MTPETIYQKLESEQTTEIQAALEFLKTDESKRNAIESRYLEFVRARLNDPTATIFQFEEAILPKEKVEKFTGSRPIVGDNYLNLERLDNEESKMIVDFIGAMAKRYLDVGTFKKEGLQKKEESELIAYSSNISKALWKNIQQEADAQSLGWFGKLYKMFAAMSISQVLMDHTSFYEANESLVLSEFMFLINSFNWSVTIDVFQSDTPDFTPIFWFLPHIPDTKWGDSTFKLPDSPLAFKRTIRFRSGDFAHWETADCIGKDRVLHSELKKQKQQSKMQKLMANYQTAFDEKNNTLLEKLTKGLNKYWNGNNETKIKLIKEWPRQLPFFTSVIELTVKYNENTDTDEGELAAIPEDIGTLQGIKELNFDDQRKLRSFPDALYNLSELEVLKLNSTYISKLDGIGKFSNLKELSLEFTNLSDFPEDFYSLTKLEKLNIKYIPLGDDPIKLQKLRDALPNVAVETTGTSINEFTATIPNHYVGLKKIEIVPSDRPNHSLFLADKVKELYIDNSFIEYLDDQFDELKQLEHLSLTNSLLVPSMGKIASLKQLTLIKNVAINCSLDGLENLKTITIQEAEKLPNLRENIEELEALEIMQVFSYNLDETIYTLPRSLKKLVIKGKISKYFKSRETYTGFVLDQHKLMAGLPNLTSLKLVNLFLTKESKKIGPFDFPVEVNNCRYQPITQ